jgi:hypothetical protein
MLVLNFRYILKIKQKQIIKEKYMISLKRQIGRSSALIAAVVVGVVAVLPALSPTQVGAVGLFTPRKMTMTSQASGSTSADINNVTYAAGAGGNGAKANHTFDFTAATSGANLGSVAIQYCTTPFFGTTCTSPTGMNAANVTNAGSTISGFAGTQPTVDTTTTANTNFFSGNACAVNTGTPAMHILAGNGATGTSYIVNPTTAGTFYVRITTFSDAAYTTIVDQGVVTGSIQNSIDITSRVQETLNFSIGNSYTAPSTNCAVLNNTGALNLGNSSNNYTLDALSAYEATSYWRLSTNANGGTTVQYSGDTLKTAAGVAITSIGTSATASAVGSEQFGLGLNSADGNQSLTGLTAQSPYASANGTITNGGTALFAHDVTSVTSPKTLASNGSGTVTCATGSVRYIANIGTTTKPGLYQTSIAYIATPTY